MDANTNPAAFHQRTAFYRYRFQYRILEEMEHIMDRGGKSQKELNRLLHNAMYPHRVKRHDEKDIPAASD